MAVVRRSQNFSPVADPLPGGAGRPKFNQLEMVTIHYLYIQTQFGEDRCTQFRVIVEQTHKYTHKHTGPIKIHCAAANAQCNHRSYQTRNSAIADKPARRVYRSVKVTIGAFHMLDISYCAIVTVFKARRFYDIRLQKCRDLENRVRGPSRSLEMSPYDTAQ